MKKLKVVTIVGTRPEIIRLSMLIPKLDEHTDHVFVHTGQNSDPKLNQVFFDDLGLRAPDYYLNVDTTSLGSVMGDTLKKSEEVLIKEKPDAVMILGDTNSAIAAVVAERMHIPVYHMEAGNRSFDKNVPEELNRRMVDHVASFNLPYNDYSMRNLLAEGIHPRNIQITGSPIAEVFNKNKQRILGSRILETLGLEKNGYILASIHRQETVDYPSRFSRVLDSLVCAGRHFQVPVIVSTHPRTRSKLPMAFDSRGSALSFYDPFGYLDYSKLQLNSLCVVSDSGTVSEESAIMGFSAISIRESIERQEALDAGSIILSGLDRDNVLQAISLARLPRTSSQLPSGYDSDNFSDKVLKFLISTANLHKVWSNFPREV